MSNKEIIAQILGFVPLILAYFVFFFNDRRKMLITKTVTDILWTVHLIMMGAVSGAIINGICIVRGIAFLNKEKVKKAGIIVPILFSAVMLISSALSWNGIISLLPAIGSTLGVIGYWCNKPENMRRVIFPGLVLWLIYCISVGSVPSTINNAISIISIIITEIRCRKKLNKDD